MANKFESKIRTATPKELFQECPKCGGEFLVRIQSKEGLEYWCQDCKHKEFRKWDSKEASEKPVLKGKEESKDEPEEPAKKLTEDEIRDLRKFEQIELLKKLGSTVDVPKYEGDRVALILKLQ